MKLKIEIDQCSENPKEWKISLAMEDVTLSGNELKKLPEIVENHIKEVWKSTINEED